MPDGTVRKFDYYRASIFVQSTIMRANEARSGERSKEHAAIALNVMFVARKRFTIADDYAGSS